TAEALLSLAREGPREQTIRTAEANLAQAQAAERQASEALALVEAGPRQEDIRASRAQVEQAQEVAAGARQRLAALRAGPTPETIAVARRQVAEARAALDVARQQARQAEVSAQQAAAAQADERRAGAAVTEAQSVLGKYVVTAPRPGVVDSLNVRAGEVASPGASLVTLVDPSDLWVQVYVPETDLARVKLGQRAQVQVDGQASPFAAEVYWIAEQAEFTPKYIQTRTERARLVYAVRVRPDNSSGALKPGMPADVTIFTN
ncbi:MAG TPA: HlyD family efflux transporter periplasmic adaptor subunit, partial [Armatimonadota bacterium]|nr:HlyD family efflux transporter periplasmic adaptor subunit [Armatimonadota bacterium]